MPQQLTSKRANFTTAYDIKKEAASLLFDISNKTSIRDLVNRICCQHWLCSMALLLGSVDISWANDGLFSQDANSARELFTRYLL